MSQPYGPPPPPTSRLRAAQLLAWAALSLAAAAFVLAYGTNSPTVDEWEFVPVLTGHEPAGPWLLARHNEHRFPLPRAVYVGLFRLTHDYRAASLFQVVCLSGLSLGLMRAAARLRGRPAWADLFFPLSLLHVGHWENLVQGYQVVFVLYTVLAGTLAVVVARATPANRCGSGVLAGVLAGLLVLCGGSGVILAVPVGLWVLSLAAAEARAGRRYRAGAVLAAALVPLAYAAWYLATYERPPHHPSMWESADPVRGVAMVAGETLAMGLVPGFALVRNPGWYAVAAGVLGLAGVTLARAVRELVAVRGVSSRHTPCAVSERHTECADYSAGTTRSPAATGTAAVVAGVLGIALATGVGRAGIGDHMGLWARYALLTWPLLGVVYLFWVPRGRWVPLALVTAAALAFPFNTAVGIGTGADVRGVLADIEADVRAGVPPERIVERFADTMQDGQQERGVVGIPMLRDAGVGAYAGKGRWDGLWWLPAGAGLLAAAAAGGWWLGHFGRAVQVERARELFRLQHERFEAALLAAAGATGKPRGLRWAGCTITGDAVLARDVAAGGIVALVPVEVRFEPEEGSDMAANPAAREPRPATAVFTFARGHWQTDGRVVFNLDPHGAAKHFGKTLKVIPNANPPGG